MELEIEKRVRAELLDWITAHINELRTGFESDTIALPDVVDFVLITAIEDGANVDSDTWYPIVSSGNSHYRKVGLLKCGLKILLKDDPEDN